MDNHKPYILIHVQFTNNTGSGKYISFERLEYGVDLKQLYDLSEYEEQYMLGQINRDAFYDFSNKRRSRIYIITDVEKFMDKMRIFNTPDEFHGDVIQALRTHKLKDILNDS